MRTEEAKKLKETQPEALEQVKGGCKFCGQIWMVNADIAWTENEINEAATEMCSCDEAVFYTNKKAQKQKANELIEEIFGDLTASQKRIMVTLAADLIEGNVNKVTLAIEKTKCNMSMTNDEKIKIKRTDTNNTEGKV